MSNLTTLITHGGYADHILSDQQLARILGGSDDRRYGQVKRALKSGDLIRLKRGVYVLADRHRTQPAHPFALAQRLVIGSYISMETALAFHGWIPEAVYTIASVTPGRKSRTVSHEQFGQFEFNPLALKTSGFLIGVDRQVLSDQPVLIATPLRALMDLIAYRKQDWCGLSWLKSSLRVDTSQLEEAHAENLIALQRVYKHKAANHFLTELENAILNMQSAKTTYRDMATS